MSSNKIGFLSASALYGAICLAIWQFDFKIRPIGEMGESKAFSLRLENIESLEKQHAQKNISHFNQKAKETKPRESNPKISADSNADLRESNAESTADSRESNSSTTQSTLGQNDPYFLAITRIINKFHAKAPAPNLIRTFEVGVAFSVNTEGEIEDLRVIKSSGNAKLDNIALRTIRRASRTFPAPKKNYHIQTALVYKR